MIGHRGAPAFDFDDRAFTDLICLQCRPALPAAHLGFNRTVPGTGLPRRRSSQFGRNDAPWQTSIACGGMGRFGAVTGA